MKNGIVWFVLLVTVVGSCSHPGPYVPVGGSPSVEDTYPVVLLDKTLKRKIAVDHTQARVMKDNRLEVLVNVRNRTKRDVAVQIQTIFKDSEGYSTGEDSAWATVFLTAHETESYRIMSRGPAVQYTVRIREAR